MKFDFYITGTIGKEYDWWTGTRGTTANQVKNFLRDHQDQEVTIAVSSLGGYIDDGLTIMEYIRNHGKCNMVIIGMTASAATILCMKAKSVKIARGSMMLIHNSSQMLDVWTSANKEKIDQIIQQFQHEREQLDTIDKCLADIYSAKNGKPIDENLELMGKEKWLSAKEALDFGLVDAVLDDDDIATKAKAVKNAYSGYAGASEHYGMPAIEQEEGKPSISFFKRIREALSHVKEVVNDAEPAAVQEEEPHSSIIINQTNTAMKKIVLNLVCAMLALQDIELNTEAGTANLSEEQLNKIENDLKEKADKINLLEQQLAEANTAKQEAVDAKAAVDQQLASLQQEFDEFKGKAGDQSPQHPASKTEGAEPQNAKQWLDSVKNIG